MFHVIHNVKPLVVEGFELIISIIIEHVIDDEHCRELPCDQEI